MAKEADVGETFLCLIKKSQFVIQTIIILIAARMEVTVELEKNTVNAKIALTLRKIQITNIKKKHGGIGLMAKNGQVNVELMLRK